MTGRGSRTGETRIAELELHCHHETASAWLVSTDGDRDRAQWIPKSASERGERTSETEPTYEFQLEEWLAVKKGLV